MDDKKKKYNDEPVFYCDQCLSLLIKIMDDYEYCDDCGNTDVRQMHIHDWEKMYRYKYGEDFLKLK